MTINITQACVYLGQNLLIISQQYNETSIITICNTKNLIGLTGLVLSNDQ